MSTPELQRWDHMVQALTSVWPSVVYIRVRERVREGNTEHTEVVLRVEPRGTDADNACPLITERYRDEFGVEDTDATAWRALSDQDLLELTVSTLHHEVVEWGYGCTQPRTLKVEFYAQKGEGLGARTVVVAPGTAAPSLPTEPPATPDPSCPQTYRAWNTSKTPRRA